MFTSSPTTSQKNLVDNVNISFFAVGILTLGLFLISFVIFLKIYEFSGCISCDCNPNRENKKILDACFGVVLVSVFVGLILIGILFWKFSKRKTPTDAKMESMILMAYAIISFFLMLLDAVVLGLIQQTKGLVEVLKKNKKSYRDFIILMSVVIGIRAAIFITFIVYYYRTLGPQPQVSVNVVTPST